jgi:hypothetical protein
MPRFRLIDAVGKRVSGQTRRTLAAIVVFALLATLLLNKSLLPGHTLLPLDLVTTIAPWDDPNAGTLANPLLSDPFYSFYPRRYLLTEALQTGQLPLWNPFIMTGIPEVANPNFQLFYPPNLIAALFLSAERALPWLAWGHLILTGSLMYLFLRRQRLHELACILGGGLWLLNGYGLVWLENPHRLSTAAWIPGIFWAFEAAVQDRKASWAALGGLFLGLTILGGQMQYVFAIGLLFGLYGLLRLIQVIRERQGGARRTIGYLMLIGVIGLSLGSVVLLPAGEFAAISQRSQFTSDTIEGTGWPLTRLVTLAMPDFYGNPAGATKYWAEANHAEMTAYFGAAALVLALTAWLVARQRRFTIVALIEAGAVMALTLGTPLSRVIFLFPGAQFVALTRSLLLIPLVGTWLAAAALDGWLTKSVTVRRHIAALGLAVFTIVVIVGLTIAALGDAYAAHRDSINMELLRGAALIGVTAILLLAMRRWPKMSATLLVIIVLGDLLAWGGNYNPIISTDYLYPDNAIVQQLKHDTGLYRVLPLQVKKMIFGPNVLSLFGLSEIGGYTPLITRDYHQLFWSIDNTSKISWMRPGGNMLIANQYHPIYDLFNVKYVLSRQSLNSTTLPDSAQPTCATPVPLAASPVTQTLTVRQAGFNRLDVYVADVDPAKGGQLEFELRRHTADGELIAQSAVPIADLGPDSYYSFYFAPVADSAGQQFVWSISATDALQACRDAAGTLTSAAYVTWLQPQGQADGVRIYENANVQPRAFIVPHVEQVSANEVITRLLSADFDWRHNALLTQSLPPEQAAQLADTPWRVQSQVNVADYRLNSVDVDVETAAAGLLVLSDAYYPGWEAQLDGQPSPIYKTNGVMRGVFVPAGTHHIRFQFDPPLLKVGGVLAAFSLLIIGSIIAYQMWLDGKARRLRS